MKKVIFTGEDYEAIIRACSPCIARLQHRPALNHIELQVKNGRCIATSLDMYIMAQCLTPCEGSNGTYIIPAYRFKRYDNVTISRNGEKISITQGDITFTKTIKQSEFIDWRTVINGATAKERQYRIFLKPQLLKRIAEAFKDESCVCLDFAGQHDAVLCSGKQTRGLLLPMRVDSESAKLLYFAHEEKGTNLEGCETLPAQAESEVI